MSNSGMVSYTRLSPNNSGHRTEEITKITPHHMAGVLSVEACGDIFANPARDASSNYGIGDDGRIGMYVEECNRSWCSSSRWNDQRAVTIEVSNSSTGGEWPVGDAAWRSLVQLCADICRRNPGIKRADGRSGLHYTGDMKGSLTEHRMFAATDCPGPWLHARMQQLADEVNAVLDGAEQPEPAPQPQPAPSPELASKPKHSTYGGKSGTGFGGTYRCTVNSLRIRTAPSLDAEVVGHYNKGQTVNLDDYYVIQDGWVWGRYTAYSGNVRYIAVGRHTGKPEPDDYLVKI